MGRDSWCEVSAGLLLERLWLFPQRTVVYKRVQTSNTSHKWQKKSNNLHIKESRCSRAKVACGFWGFVRAPASFAGRHWPALCCNTGNAGFALLQRPVFPLAEAVSETRARHPVFEPSARMAGHPIRTEYQSLVEMAFLVTMIN
jgi:hypothetical protein